MGTTNTMYVFLIAITMAMPDGTNCQLAAIATRLPEIITLLENVTDFDWQRNLQNTQNQIANSQNQTASTLTEMANTQTQMASNMTNLLHMQSQQLQNLTAAMTTMVSLLETHIELLHRLPIPPRSDCSDVAAQGFHINKPYTITPQDGLGSLTVYCDLQTAGGGWTVFQRRYDGSVDFYLGWNDYERGFGSPDGEHWMALREIHRLTRNGRWTLRIDMEAFDGDVAYAEYDSFSIADAGSNYRLSIGAYSGTAGDSLRYHNNRAFSTKDRENDASSGSNCAVSYKGAWWYGACQVSNLNGLYLGPSGSGATANKWYRWKSAQSLKRSEMKMRRVQ